MSRHPERALLVRLEPPRSGAYMPGRPVTMEEQSRVEDIMTRNVVVLAEEDNLSQVAAGLDRYRFHHLPVVDGTKLVGILSQRDILRNTVSGVDRSAVASTREAR